MAADSDFLGSIVIHSLECRGIGLQGLLIFLSTIILRVKMVFYSFVLYAKIKKKQALHKIRQGK